MSNQWHDLCARLNVKPKQFAVLLAITVGSVGVLGVKFFVLKPRKAGAEIASASADAGGGNPGASGAGMHVDGNAAPMASVAVTLATRPERDPFAPFFVYHAPEGEDASAQENSESASDGGGVMVKPMTDPTNLHAVNHPAGGAGPKAAAPAKAGATKHTGGVPGAAIDTSPQGLFLKAIIGGRVAVMNDMSVEVGDVIYDDAGQAFTVMAIHERSITVSDGRKPYPIGYAAPPTGGSKRAKAPGAPGR